MVLKNYDFNKFGCFKKNYDKIYGLNIYKETQLKTLVLIRIHKRNFKLKEILIRKTWRIWVSDMDKDEIIEDILKSKKIKNNLKKKINFFYDAKNFIKKF